MIKRDLIDEIEVLTLDGRIDQDGAENLENIIQDCLDDEHINICIDMVSVKHICSSALGVLVAKKRKITNTNGDIKLVISSDNILKLFQTTMLDKVFEIFDSRRECIVAFE